jgi:hypothetical protein
MKTSPSIVRKIVSPVKLPPVLLVRVKFNSAHPADATGEGVTAITTDVGPRGALRASPIILEAPFGE